VIGKIDSIEVADIAIQRTRRSVARKLAGGNDSVVTATASSYDPIVIDRWNRRPNLPTGMAVITGGIRLNIDVVHGFVVLVTGAALTLHKIVVHLIHRLERPGIVTILTLRHHRDMIRWAGRVSKLAVVTALTIVTHQRVVHLPLFRKKAGEVATAAVRDEYRHMICRLAERD